MKRKLIYALVLFSMLLGLIARGEAKPPPKLEVAIVDKDGKLEPVLTADDFANVTLQPRAVDITLTPCGTRVFREVTKHNVGNKMAIVLDGKVVATPVLRVPISDGHVQVSY